MGSALRWGFRETVARWPGFIAYYGTRAVAVVCGVAAGALLTSWWRLGLAPTAAGLGLLGTAWIAAELAGTFLLGGLLASARPGREGGPRALALADVLAAARPCVGFLSFRALLDLLGFVFWAAALGSTVWSLARALHRGPLAVVAAAAVALAVMMVLTFALFAALWTEMAFARSVARQERYATALFGAAAVLAERMGAALAILVLTFVLSAVAQSALAGILWGGGFLGRAMVVGLLTGFAAAFFEVVRLLAFLALDAAPPDKGPIGGPVEPVPMAEPILDAEPVLDAVPL